MTLRRTIWPLREAMNSLIRDASPLVTDETRLYLRDCYDHTVRVIDFIETYRELGSDLMDLYLSSISQRMTEVMKVLTIIATVFIPLTFISSIYGMNFQTERSPWNMPELTWYLGYPFALASWRRWPSACSSISAARAGSDLPPGRRPRLGTGPPQPIDTVSRQGGAPKTSPIPARRDQRGESLVRESFLAPIPARRDGNPFPSRVARPVAQPRMGSR